MKLCILKMGVIKVTAVLFVIASIITAICFHCIITYEVTSPEVNDGWFGKGPRQEEKDLSVRKFNIKVTDNILKDLKTRLKNTRFHTDLEDGDFTYGFQSSYLKKVVTHWLDKFDWRKQENKLNSFSHYKTTIEGLQVHFIHEKPKKAKKGIPLLMVHGWPGSVWEFHKILPLLTGAEKDINFEVVCPSIPGYGFSDAASKKGFSPVDAARMFMKLMKRLGYEQYYVQGGDWGAVITSIMASLYPNQVLGLHSNFFQAPPLPKTLLKEAIGSVLPCLVYSDGEADMVYPMLPKLLDILVETGYMHIQATKPDTIGTPLTDSPAGLAAYILEKFGTWTNRTCRSLPDGGITQKHTLDDLLTNVMIYWTNKNIASSCRFYKEYFISNARDFQGVVVNVPTGLAQFPEEMVMAPRSLMSDKYPDIVQYTLMPRGGHFAAFEEPHLLESDIRNFVRKVEARNGDNKKSN